MMRILKLSYECVADEGLKGRLKSFNGSLIKDLEESPVMKGKHRTRKMKLAKIGAIAKKTMKLISPDEDIEWVDHDSLICNELKSIINKSNKYQEKVHYLTVAAAAKWTVGEIAKFFNVTNYAAAAAISLFKEHGLLAKLAPPKCGSALPETTLKLVDAHYLDTENSKELPGIKDRVIVRVSGEKLYLQKRLILHTLKFLYELLQQDHPEIKVGFTKFTQLRPPQCVFPGGPGTLIMCVCLIHANPALMIEVLDLKQIFPSLEKTSFVCADFLELMMCKTPTEDCFLNCCSLCPGADCVRNALLEYFDSNDIDHVNYSQWLFANNFATFSAVTSSPIEFTDSLIPLLEKLLVHRYIVKQQHMFMEETVETLSEGKVLILCDFAENYRFIIQNSIQAQHWNKSQAAVHIFVVLFKENAVLKQINFVSISDFLLHNTAAVHLFQTRLFGKLQSLLPWSLKKVKYMSDGSAAQYKNKFNFANILLHEADFGIPSEWHFHPTSHGKNRCDGIAGIVKGSAFRASHTKNSASTAINTPQRLYEYTRDTFPNIVSDFSTTEEHLAHTKKLKSRFAKCVPLPGCRSMHSFVPISKDSLSGKIHSNCVEDKVYKLVV